MSVRPRGSHRGKTGCRSCVYLRRPRFHPWRRLFRTPGPLGAKLPGELLRLLVVRAGEGEDAPALVHGDLGHDVGRGPEAVETEPLGIAGETQRAVPDQARA